MDEETGSKFEIDVNNMGVLGGGPLSQNRYTERNDLRNSKIKLDNQQNSAEGHIQTFEEDGNGFFITGINTQDQKHTLMEEK